MNQLKSFVAILIKMCIVPKEIRSEKKINRGSLSPVKAWGPGFIMFYLIFRLQNKIFRVGVSNGSREPHKPVGHVMGFRPSSQSTCTFACLYFSIVLMTKKRQGCSFKSVSRKEERMI